jgi:hypothetical protein
MGYLQELPEAVVRLIRTQFVCEYATVSQAGVPIDTPTLVHASADLTTLDIVTGLAYPAKADRARRNPKVGLLLERGANAPVVSVAGIAAVRDCDLQANMDRCLAESVVYPYIAEWDYQTVVRKAVWYFTRMFVAIAPAHIRWWPNRAAMDGPPQEWRALPGAVFPPSDPTPPGKPSPSPGWPAPDWREMTKSGVERGGPAYLTLLDDEGFPLPFPALEVARTDDGLILTLPPSAPWSGGRASVSFEGVENLVGEATREGDRFHLKVERALPILPLMNPPNPMNPSPDVKAKLMERLEHECARRGQPIPTMPAEPPEPTAGARMRMEGAQDFEFHGNT